MPVNPNRVTLLPYALKHVQIERTGAFLVARDINGNFHLGTDIYSSLLSLPGGNIEASDRNLYAAARRETRQEFGHHMRYVLMDEKPIVFLCSIDDDSLVRHPRPGQRVKLRVAFIVMEAHGNLPREQKSREMLDPHTVAITLKTLPSMAMRESSRIAIRIALERAAKTKMVYKPGLAPSLRQMRHDMIDLLVPPETYNYHGTKVAKSSPLKHQPDGDYLSRLRKAEIAARKKMREAKRREAETNRNQRLAEKLGKQADVKLEEYTQEATQKLPLLLKAFTCLTPPKT